MKRQDMLMTLFAKVPVAMKTTAGDITIEGDASLYDALVDMIEPVDSNFNIVTP
jgi:alkyl sulfatase BDS1-like metallo-beta-lactamase superfamily hydrolase